ncbi:D-alanyl-D-alanine carboxypeptidase family protein [Enterococcus casseliflavus]|uniref:D-alanyl-D-alanine carboxypeptidase family protein n=1 Tax=Enterococcus casseliflavus TaxID=37734 RepID=UPI0016439A12|nr:D-alanyl-D-alanine carboxypeptidase family protein [Enterococcus casseliflavus]
MKRYFLFTLPIFILISFAGCSNSNEEKIDTSASKNTNNSTAFDSKQASTNEPSVKQEEKIVYTGDYELPLNGSTGFAAIDLQLKEELNWESPTVTVVKESTNFCILAEKNGWINVKLSDGSTGWLPSQHCFINLPDIIPSIIYKNTNSERAIFKSSYESIPNITDQLLYESKTFNDRLNQEQFIIPILFPVAKKIMNAQKKALQENNTLIIYEGFRPWDVQQKIAANLQSLAQSNPNIMNGLNQPPWSIDWFISTKVSNHQIGYAIDVSLGKVTNFVEKIIGDYKVTTVDTYEEYQMQTPMHELSLKSAIFTVPIPSLSLDWQQGVLSQNVNDYTVLLQKYLTESGLTPLASEWWHFNDLDAYRLLENKLGTGNYRLDSIVSTVPN